MTRSDIRAISVVRMLHRPLFIGSDIYRTSRYGGKHPLAIPRVSVATDLARCLGWLDDGAYVDSPQATPEQLLRFHDPGYVAALMRAERDQALPDDLCERYHIGRSGNPIFGEVFRRPATACGASILGATLIREGGIVHSPAGGTHHGRRDRASGFCYLNDPALAILTLLDQGIERVYYVDVDAHHGDGVEDAFADDPRVLTVSVHEAGRWPHTGLVGDRAGGSARNLPVPAGFNDCEMDHVLEGALIPLGERFRPQAMVLQCGVDALADDPMSRLELSNRAIWRVVRRLRDLAPRLLVLGGGGYNPWSVGRCWTGVWATLNDYPIPEILPPEAAEVLASLTWPRCRPPDRHWLTTLADSPRPGPIRPVVRDVVSAVMR